MSTSSEKAIEKINWPLWIAIVVVVNVLANLAQGVLGTQGQYFGCIYSMGIVCQPFTLPILALMIPMLAYATRFVGKVKLSPTVLATLYVMGLVSSYAIGNFNDTYYSWPVGSVSRVWKAIPEVRDAMKKLWWVPPEAAVAPTWGAGGSVDWAAWFPAMLYVFLFHFILLIITSAEMAILRRQWIEIEKIPFPFAIAIWESVRNIHGFEEVKHRRRPFIIGLLVGLIIYMQIMFTVLLPWWPDVIGWRALGPPSPNGCVDPFCVASLKPLATSLVAFMKINVQPINFAIAYLAPLDIIFSVWFLWVIFMLLAQIAYYMGFYTGALDTSGNCRVLWGPHTISPNWGPPFYWSYMCTTGGLIAFIAMILWRARDYLRGVLNAVLGKPSSTIREVEAEEPVSYRTASIMFLVGCILFVAFLASLQIDFILGAIVFILGALIYPVAEAYARGLTGALYLGGRLKWPGWPIHFIWSRHPGVYTPGWCNAIIILHRGVNTASGGLNTWSEVTMHSFRVADLSGVHPKTIYKMVFVFFIIAYAITLPFRVWWPHYLGARFPNCWTGWECASLGEGPYNTVPPANELWIPVISGFIVTMLLYLLRMRFAWWPLHPLGFLLTGPQTSCFIGVWTNFLVAWIAKWLTLKIGGSKAYEEHGIPVAAGILAGFVLAAIIGVIVGLIRWFVPF